MDAGEPKTLQKDVKHSSKEGGGRRPAGPWVPRDGAGGNVGSGPSSTHSIASANSTAAANAAAAMRAAPALLLMLLTPS